MKSSKLQVLLLIILLISGCGGGGGGGGALPSRTLVAIAVTPATPTIAKGATQQFAAIGTYSDSSTQDISASVNWTSSNSGVATISGSGLATSVAVGTTIIDAASGSISGSTNLTVTAALLVSLQILPTNPSIPVGSEQQFSATGTYSDSTSQDLTASATWSSSDFSVATISNSAGSNGRAASIGPGTTTITARSGSVSGSTLMTVAGGGVAVNVLAVTVDGSLCTNYPGLSYPNKPCVSVTICTPGASSCQTVTDILLDTGSFGLRIFSQALTVPLVQATVAAGALTECVQFADNSALWGPVKLADVVLGGEPAVRVPVQVIDAAFGTVPISCGTPDARPAVAGFNGILGVGLFVEDCGPGCSASAANGRYYGCSGASCSGTAVPLASQVQNPAAHLPLDNNGVILSLPAVPSGGTGFVNGQLLLGIGTRANNVPSGVTAFPADQSGEFTTLFNGTTFTSSFIDSGSNGLFFSAPAALLPLCAAPNNAWYCPSALKSLSAVNSGAFGSPSGTVTFQIGNAISLFNSRNMVFAELGGFLPGGFFDWGLPFFFGRPVYVGFEPFSGMSPTSLGSGPFWAY